jgi:putative transposase
MSAKFQNKYRIPSARWQSWDYSSEGLYFITINAVHHECLFGTIVDKEMHLSVYGQIVAEEWNKSFEIRTGLFCDAFVIMPNHIHAILRIEYPVETHCCASDDHLANNFDVETHRCASLSDNNTTETHGCASLLGDNNIMQMHSSASLLGDNNIMQPHNCASLRDDDNIRASIRGARDGYGVAFREQKSISSFVGGFKSVVTARINTLRQTKGQKVWQYRFHDHVIRDYEACRRIGAYIDSNIANWKDDCYYG